MVNYEDLIAFALSTAALAISPGPDNIYVLTQSVVNGKKYGLATVAGLISGCLVHTTLLAFGISTMIKNNAHMYLAIKMAGVVYLLFLAHKVLKSEPSLQLAGDAGPKKGFLELYKQGFVMNVLNPKVTIFFLAFFPGFLFSDTLGLVFQFYVLGLVFMGVSGLIFTAVAVLAGSISAYVVANRKAAVFLKWMQVIVFIGIALYLLLSAK